MIHIFSFVGSECGLSNSGHCHTVLLIIISPEKTVERSWNRWTQFARCHPPPDSQRRACRWCQAEVARLVLLSRLFCEDRVGVSFIELQKLSLECQPSGFWKMHDSVSAADRDKNKNVTLHHMDVSDWKMGPFSGVAKICMSHIILVLL